MSDNLNELQALLMQFKDAVNTTVALKNVLNGRLNFPPEGRQIPHELLDQYWNICNVLRSEVG